MSGASAQRWTIASAVSQVQFVIRVAWVRRLSGVFERIEGHVEQTGPDRFSVDVRVPAEQLTMDNPEHAAWARSAEFFDVARYPWIAFHADDVPADLLRDGGELVGELMLRGIRQPQTLLIEPADCDRPGRDCPLQARAELRRSTFGMDSRRVLVGDRVRLQFTILLED